MKNAKIIDPKIISKGVLSTPVKRRIIKPIVADIIMTDSINHHSFLKLYDNPNLKKIASPRNGGHQL